MTSPTKPHRESEITDLENWLAETRGDVAQAKCFSLSVPVHRITELIDEIFRVKEQARRLAEELEEADRERKHFYALAVDDPGKNPPEAWRDVAHGDTQPSYPVLHTSRCCRH